MENVLGYLASALIGVSLGLIGGGGSIITIPVLVYFFHIEPTLATVYSLFIVGATSLAGSIRNSLLRMVDFKSAWLFSIPTTIAVYVTRHFLLPRIPEEIASIGLFTLTKDIAIMLFFSVVLVLAAIRMIRDRNRKEKEIATNGKKVASVFVAGSVIGVVTGIIGAGGGFLITPALVLLIGLPMKKAIGTSLVIIAITSFVGFVGDIHLLKEIDFTFMMILTSLAVSGIFIGVYLAKFIDGKKLKSGFGWFALAVVVFIVTKEVLT